MSASLEWTDWHLTPEGWVAGTIKRDNGTTARDAPSDRVKTSRYIEECNGYGPVHGRIDHCWIGPDKDAIGELLAKFGPSPQEL